MLNFNDAEKMSISDVYEIYSNFSNKRLPDLYKRFQFGRELIYKASGSFLETSGEKKVLDLTGGLGVANFGHNHPSILDVRKRYVELGRPEIHKSYFNPFLAAASKNLAEVLDSTLKYSFFCNSGAEAVDGALKLTYKRHNGNRKFALHSDRSFHGQDNWRR